MGRASSFAIVTDLSKGTGATAGTRWLLSQYHGGGETGAETRTIGRSPQPDKQIIAISPNRAMVSASSGGSHRDPHPAASPAECAKTLVFP